MPADLDNYDNQSKEADRLTKGLATHERNKKLIPWVVAFFVGVLALVIFAEWPLIRGWFPN